MSYLIDTNIISEVRKGAKCDSRVATWYESIADAEIFLSVLALGEIRKGVERARSSRPAQAQVLERWLETIMESFADRILPVDQGVADNWGRMSATRSVPTIDGLLAAAAKAHLMTLVTRNIADVADLGVEVLNPFLYKSR